MEHTDFKGLYPGEVVDTGEYFAFQPNPLPPKLSWTSALVRKLADAQQAIGELSGTARTLPNPHVLMRPFQDREAQLSSKLEGTNAEIEDVAIYEVSISEKSPTNKDKDIQEVWNYRKAIEVGIEAIDSGKSVDLELIKVLHYTLLTNTRGEDKTPGYFRTKQNWIDGKTPQTARFVPPTAEFMVGALEDLESYIKNESPYPTLVDMALIHYQFETIHPFRDGNGRIGRLLVLLLLYKKGLLSGPLLYLSAYFEKNKARYKELLLNTSQTNDWDSWICFFLDGITEQARDACNRAKQLVALWEDIRKKLQAQNMSGTVHQLLDMVFMRLAVTASTVSTHLELTPKSSQACIEKLVQIGFLKETTGKKHGRIYVASQLFRIVNAP